MELNNIIFVFLLLIFSFSINKYFLLFLNKKKINLFFDNEYKKPQAFHKKSTYRIGGISIYLSLSLVFIYLYFFQKIYFFEYISFCTIFFLIGLIDDMKVKIMPKFRLGAMIFALIFLVISNKIYIEKSGLQFLNNLLEIDIFALIFVILCFLFIVNGSNLIDGFNGLLGIHSIIILLVLFFINLINDNTQIAFVLFFAILCMLVFLKFNIPNAQIFLGDSGAYLVGAFIALSVIKSSVLNPNISPFFFCVLLIYLFFEVFFSFFRKIFIARQSPLLPDGKHLHMNLYKFLLKKNKSEINSNYKVSIYINSIYFLFLIPAIFFMYNGLFCRYYFFLLFFIYIYFYMTLEKII